MLSAAYDETTGIVTTVAAGLSSVEDFNTYVPILIGFLTKSAMRHGKWLHVVDATANSVQSKESTEHVSAMWNSDPRDDGYTAYVVSSVLAKMQIQRMRDYENRGFFTEVEPARAWLLDRACGTVADRAKRA